MFFFITVCRFGFEFTKRVFCTNRDLGIFNLKQCQKTIFPPPPAFQSPTHLLSPLPFHPPSSPPTHYARFTRHPEIYSYPDRRRQQPSVCRRRLKRKSSRQKVEGGDAEDELYVTHQCFPKRNIAKLSHTRKHITIRYPTIRSPKANGMDVPETFEQSAVADT